MLVLRVESRPVIAPPGNPKVYHMMDVQWTTANYILGKCPEWMTSEAVVQEQFLPSHIRESRVSSPG